MMPDPRGVMQDKSFAAMAAAAVDILIWNVGRRLRRNARHDAAAALNQILFADIAVEKGERSPIGVANVPLVCVFPYISFPCHRTNSLNKTRQDSRANRKERLEQKSHEQKSYYLATLRWFGPKAGVKQYVKWYHHKTLFLAAK
jgi:hypothetical protein